MGFFSKKLKDIKETQIIAKDFLLDDLLSPDIIKELKEKFSGDVVLIPSSIKFQVIPKEQSPLEISRDAKDKKTGIQITLSPADFITLEHPSPVHYENKIVVITSNKNNILKKFLE